MEPPRPEAGQPLTWTEAGPRSQRFDDVYFSAVDGLAEARTVFLQGCGLPGAWSGRHRFVVAELGFGTGLNILALVELWRRTRPVDAQLHVFSVEAYPLTRDEAARALSPWGDLTDLAAPLLAAWPDDRRGFHRIDFAQAGARLDLWIGEAADGLRAWDGAADAWFLDGFAPARNPQMWRPEVLELVAEHAAPGARLATFTVAGAVRRGLQAAGFEVARAPGFGRKRQRLEARRAGDPGPDRARAPPVAVIGAGIAGAALARALAALGVRPLVIEAARAGAGASGNPAALVTPRLDAGLGPVAELHAQAFARAVELYRREAPDAVLAQGALQLEVGPRDSTRFDRIAAWPGFASGALTRLDAAEMAAALQEPTAPAGLRFRDALVVDPAGVLESWLAAASVSTARVARLEPAADGWRLLDEAGGLVGMAETVALACGPDTAALLASLGLATPLQPVRGQVSWSSRLALVGEPAAWGGYAVPTPDGGALFGATHGRGDWDTTTRPADNDRNLGALRQGRPALASRLDALGAGADIQARASLRAATPDHTPLAGPAPGCDGLFVLSGLGGRGFTLAPLLAEHLAALMLGAPSPLPRSLGRLTAPARYLDATPAAGEPKPPSDG